MTFDIYQVNAFCAPYLKGNPAAVCLSNAAAGEDTAWMQAVATELNVSETAFVYELGADKYRIRWFSPKKEIPLCGHATLASAHVLYDLGHIIGDRIDFVGIKENLAATRSGERIELDFPAIQCEPTNVVEWFTPAFKVSPVDFLQGPAKYLAVVSSESEVLKLDPDLELLRKVADRGVIVTSLASTPPHDIVSRYFAAYVGVDEDPVTGAAHCCLGPYWSGRLGKSELYAYQASARGGELRVRTNEDRVYLAGKATTTSHNKIEWPKSS